VDTHAPSLPAPSVPEDGGRAEAPRRPVAPPSRTQHGSAERSPWTPAGARSRGRHRRRRHWPTAVLTGLVVVAGLLVTGMLPVQLMRVGSGSMAPTIEGGDLVLVLHGADFHRMDVVAVQDPLGPGLLTKRAVAVGGDTVGLEDGVLVVNGEQVCEPTIDPARIDGVWFGPVTVPEDAVFLLGDERDGSVDSRVFGTLPSTDVVGRVPMRLWPDPTALQPASC
jgi:signal peptidase I